MRRSALVLCLLENDSWSAPFLGCHAATRELPPGQMGPAIHCADVHSMALRDRPTRDQIALANCYVLSALSEAPKTRHGCFIYAADGKLVSCGYNGCVQGVTMPPEAVEHKPTRVRYFLCSEENACTFTDVATRLKGATMYVTGRPCLTCGRRAIQLGISRIVYGSVKSTCASDPDDWAAIEAMAAARGVELERYTGLPFRVHASFDLETGGFRTVDVTEPQLDFEGRLVT